MFLNKELIKIPAFSSKWLFGCFVFLMVGQFLDGLTTKIGLDLGLAEVGTYAMPVLGAHGFWGLMAWKYSLIVALGVLYFLLYYVVQKFNPALLKLATVILTVGCLIGVIATVQVDISNILQLMHYLNK
jgi:hypothetical protein